MTDRGAGRLAGSFGQVRRSGNSQAASSASSGSAPPAPTRRRRRQKPGKRSRPAEYAQASGFVRRGVLDRVEQAKADPAVRAQLENELSAAAIEFKAGDPDYGALCELLLEEWLSSAGYGRKETR